MNEITLKANAKLNLTLDICGKRDDGYHLLDSVMQSISLHDTVKLQIADKISVCCDCEEINGEDNIAYLSAVRFFEYVGISGGVKISINKNIPLASGMGGGSADAAAVICGLNKLYKTGLDETELCKIGATVGADVPFCIIGGTARVGGIGEKIEKLPDIPQCYIVVVKAGEKSSTKDMYKKLDGMDCLPLKTDEMIKAINNRSIKEISLNCSNAFSSVFDYGDIKEVFIKTLPLGVSLSGSGPTVFSIYDGKEKAERCAELLNGTVTVPQSKGIIFE
ncbi:MAG: 4-(cytidine 5'-diphospho)-2-C-methyl-D-erythritol kinase [Clostridia bacterium]|nr:4-(cytidine 5'-diphospho)-2-C-methyl-D-erythritol kinase [Clostridia bacterium]